MTLFPRAIPDVRPLIALIALLLLSGGAWGPARAQSAPAAPVAAADRATDQAVAADAARLEALITTIEDPAKRQVLVDQLRTLLEAQAARQAAVEETLGTRLLTGLSDRVEALSAQIATAGQALTDTPRALRWLRKQVTEPAQREAWAALGIALAVIVAAGYAARMTVGWLIRRPRAAFGARAPSGLVSKLLLLTVRLVLDLMPVAAFALAGYGVLSATDPPRAVRLAALTFLNASILVQLVIVLARAVASPVQSPLRLLPVGDETAHYLVIWVRRIALTAVYGYFIAEVAKLLGLPADAHAAMLKLVGLVVAAMLVILVLQNRRAVGDWLRGSGGPTADERGQAADRALVAALSGTATPEEAARASDAQAPGGPAPTDPTTPRATPEAGDTGRGRTLRAARRRLADTWHILAIVYIVAIYGIWALRIEGGFEFIVRATLVTGLTLVLARYIALGVDRVIRRGFAVAPELKAQHPLLEARANRYLPVLHRILKGAVWLVAGLVILNAWGVNSLGWLATPFGQRISASLVSIALILVLALIAWELVSGMIERYLTATDPGGQVVERSARMRTLLPLMKNAVMVLLVTLVTLTVLSEMGVDIAPLLAGAGVIGLAVGFGAQTLVKDVITGLFILVEDTISVGDVVTVAGTGGVVEAISIRTLRLRDVAGTVHTVPYSTVTTVSNMTKDFSFYVFDVGIAYKENTDRVVEVLKQIGAEMQADPAYAPCILAPLEIMGLDAFRDSAVIIKARFKTRPIKQWFVGREFNRRLKQRFDELGIEIPFPHQTIYFGQEPEASAPGRQALGGPSGPNQAERDTSE
ncbi:MAG: hypothetical protein RLY86_751 [Pseudomonadota bacterium]|jgi:small conductance mechanosensitive channel